MRLLLTCSDRAVPQGPHAARGRDPSDRGPVMRLLEQKESRDQYDAAWVLTTPEHARGAKTLAADMHVRIADVTVHVLDVTDPSDYAPLFAAVQDAAAKAATIDPRFYPVQAEEVDALSIEVSVLSPMRPVEGTCGPRQRSSQFLPGAPVA